MYKWFLASRYLSTKLIAFFGIASVMLCVAMVLVVLSVMGGFLDTVRERSRGLHSELILDSGSLQGFPFYEEFGTYAKEAFPDLVSVTTPVIYSYGIFRVPATNWTKPTRIVGIRMDDYIKVNDFAKGLHYQRYYPGTTHLGLQAQPVAGVDGDGRLALPDDLEKANRRWQASEVDRKRIESFAMNPFEIAEWPHITTRTAGERAYAADFGSPRYDGEKHYGIVVGTDMLNERRPDGKFNRYVARGAQVALTLLPLTPKGNATGEPPVRLPLRYVDDSHTGIYEIDNLCVYVDFDMVQQKLAMDAQERTDGTMAPARANQLLIGLVEGADMDAAKVQLADAWDRFRDSVEPNLDSDERLALDFAELQTWEDLQRPFIAAVEKEKVLVTFLFSMISMVAIVLVGCIFYMIVEKKTRDIGILKALGASGRGVAILFIGYATAVGVVGTALGSGLGSVIVWRINDIQDFLASLHPELRVWSPEVYSFDQIPNIVKPWDVFLIALFAVVATVIGSLIPAWIAARVWPIKALRYE